MAVAVRLLGKEIHRLKLRRLDLPAADLRLGKEVYALRVSRAQPELITQLDSLGERITSLRKREDEGAATFAGKGKNTAQAFGRIIQTGWFELRFRRVARQLGRSARQDGGSNSDFAETEACTRIAQNIDSLDAAICALRAKTHPWARRPLLLASSLLLLLVAGAAVVEMKNRRTRASALSEHHLRLMFTQAERDFEENERQRAEASRREAQRTEERIAAAQRTDLEEAARKRAEQAKRTADRVAADRAKEEQEAKLRIGEEKKRKEAERIAAAKEQKERIEREAQRAEVERKQVAQDRIAAETKRQEEEKARVEREKTERERQRLAEEKKMEAERIAAEDEKKKQAEREKAALARAERLKALRDAAKQEALANARLKILHNFPQRVRPSGNLHVAKDGSLYGTTWRGGEKLSSGTAFRISSKGEFTTLFAFEKGELSQPRTGIIEGNDGNFYGTTSEGGYSYGAVYRITPEGQFSVIHKFGSREGHNPEGGLTLGRDGNFYGVTRLGGVAEGGTIYKLTPGGVLTTLHSFMQDSNDGSRPEGGLIQASDGNFYGTTSVGGTHGGRMRMTPQGSRYGPEEKLGTRNGGTIFRMTPAGGVTTLYRLNDRTWDSTNEYEGRHPKDRLLEGKDGNFYGTTAEAGMYGRGTIFKMTPRGELRVLHNFKDEGPSMGGLAQASDGNIVGTTSGMNGTANGGTIFRVAPDGEVETLYVFKNRSGTGAFGWSKGNDPITPVSGLYVHSDGKLFGLTEQGGTSRGGVLFVFDPSANFKPSDDDRLRAERMAAEVTLPVEEKDYSSGKGFHEDPRLLDKLYAGQFDEIGRNTWAKLDLIAVLKGFQAVGLNLPSAEKLEVQPADVMTIMHYFADDSVALLIGSLTFPAHPNFQAVVIKVDQNGGTEGEWARTTYKNLLRLGLQRGRSGE